MSTLHVGDYVKLANPNDWPPNHFMRDLTDEIAPIKFICDEQFGVAFPEAHGDNNCWWFAEGELKLVSGRNRKNEWFMGEISDPMIERDGFHVGQVVRVKAKDATAFRKAHDINLAGRQAEIAYITGQVVDYIGVAFRGAKGYLGCWWFTAKQLIPVGKFKFNALEAEEIILE